MSWVWNDERKAELRRLHGEGLSFGVIWKRLGAPTRSTVVSKAHRMGLEKRRPDRVATARKLPNAPRPKRRPRRAAQSPFASEPVPDFGPDLVIPQTERKRLVELGDQDCHWPIGDPQAADFHFCAKRKVLGQPYCEFHVRRAFQPPEVRTRRPELASSKQPALEPAE